MRKEELKLFINDKPSLKERFIIFMNLLVNNQSQSRLESILFFAIFYLQTIVGFFSPQIGILDPDKSTSDKILVSIEKIIRFKEIVKDSKEEFEAFIYIWAIILILITIIVLFVLFQTGRNSLYSTKYYFINIIIKISYYFCFNIILDFFSTLLCFGEGENKFVKNYSCSIGDHIIIFIVSFISTLYCIFMVIFLQTYYVDSFYLSVNYYAQLSTPYSILMALNSILFSIMKSLVSHITKEIFLIINFIISISLFNYYIQKVIYYDNITNIICGIFHILYIWTSLFLFIVNYLTISELGLFWLISSLIVIFIFFNIKIKFENWIFCKIPYFKIHNISHLLYYLRSIITMINTGLEVQSIKTRLTGIIQLHIIECPNSKCLTKTKQKLYLPASEEWSDRSKPFIIDKVFLNSLIIAIMNYFISSNFYSPELLINFSYYYLDVIGNICLSIYFLHKVELMKMSKQELFTLERLKLVISQKLVEKLKKENESCLNLEDLNTSYFYKYEYNKSKFYEEIMKDLKLTEEFWTIFSKKENKSIIDFNQVFKKAEQIMISKSNVENLWNKLYSIYSGINELFDFYCDYVEQINDDSFLKRELEAFKRKNETSSDTLNQNFYNLIFRHDTGIAICNGDNGKEGIIEKVNFEFEKIFKFPNDELIGQDISILMPKIFANQHKNFVQNYINIGEKIIIDTKEHHTFAKDKNNSIIFIKLYIKLFPVLNDSVYFIGMILPEKIDDLIFIDSNFIIQGMSKKIQDTLKLKNKLFFIENDVPFYMICKNFINFYKIFMKGNKQQILDESNLVEESDSVDLSQTVILDKDQLKIEEEQQEANIEINENIELEYEIKIPIFMMDFQNTSKKDLMIANAVPETIIVEKSNLIDNTILNSDENSLLIPKEDVHYNITINDEKISSSKNVPPVQNSNYLTPSGNTPTPNLITPNDNKDNNNLNNTFFGNTNIVFRKTNSNKVKFKDTCFQKTNSTDDIFYQKLNIYKKLFSYNKFTELEDIIENDTKDKNTLIYKFNFTFRKYNYRKDKVCFVIRCIDNKSEKGLNQSDDDSQNNDAGKKIISTESKLSSLKKCHEIKLEEKERLLNNINNFGNYLYDDEEFQKTILEFKENIKKYSRVHGSHKQNTVYDDENASQSSAPGFNSDLSKINRIFEIRESILKNNKSLHSLYFMLFTALFFVFGAGIFSSIFFIIYRNIDKNLNKLDTLQSYFFIVENGLLQIISSCISILTLVQFNYSTNFNLKFNSFIEDQNLYFKTLINQNINWTDDTTTKLILIERYLSEFSGDDNFWSRVNVTYPYIEMTHNDDEAFPISLTKCLVDASTLLHDLSLQRNITSYSEDGQHELYYLTFQAIFNSYDFIIPILLKYNDILLDYIVWKNNENINPVWYLNIIYLVFCCICFAVYLWQLMVTNNFMGEGVEKIVKISQDKVEEMIEKVKTFKLTFENNIENNKKNTIINNEDNKSESIEDESEKISKKNTTKKEIQNVPNQKNQSIILKRQESSDFNLDFKQNKKLNLQNSSYIHLTLIFLVCISACISLFIISRKAIKNNIQIMKVQSYLFGRFAYASCRTVKSKCILAQCNVNNTLICTSFLNKNLQYSYYSSLSHYPLLNEFYNKNFLLNACGAVYDYDTDEYNNCLKKPIVELINNTDAFIDLIDEKVANLLYEYESNLDTNSNSSFSSFYLFSSNTFSVLENIYYTYVIPVIDRLDDVILKDVNKELSKNKNTAIIVIMFLMFAMIIFIIYVKFRFLKKLDYFLKISKCIVKIIPSTMISTNQDLENWLEKMNNKK